MYNNAIMDLAINRANITMNENVGGPFGAAIITPDGRIVVASNTVLKDNDPTAHAEINAIRETCKTLGTYDLTGCILYTTAYPCPMCLSAIMWANIKTVYYGCSKEDTDDIGFRDDFMYKFMKDDCSNINVMKLEQADRDKCIKLFNDYVNHDKQLY